MNPTLLAALGTALASPQALNAIAPQKNRRPVPWEKSGPVQQQLPDWAGPTTTTQRPPNIPGQGGVSLAKLLTGITSAPIMPGGVRLAGDVLGAILRKPPMHIH